VVVQFSIASSVPATIQPGIYWVGAILDPDMRSPKPTKATTLQ